MKIFKKLAFVMAVAVMTIPATVMAGDNKGKNEETAPSKGIVFTPGSWAQILKKAKAENKIIFFDAYTTWCGPCKLLQKNVFTRADVAEVYNKNFINVKVDMESGEGPMLAQKYPLQGYPTLMFIDGDGNLVKELLGYQTPETLIKVGKSLVKGGSAL